MLVLVLLLVACIGLVIGKDSAQREPSATELALAQGSAAAQSLAGTAASLAETGPRGDAADYAALAEMLALHAEALKPGGGAPELSGPGESPTEASSPASPTAEPAAPSPSEFLSELTGSYTQSFEAASSVDAGPARVLASTATAQWLQARLLAEKLGTTMASAPVPEAPYDDGGTPPCPADSALEPDPGLNDARTAVIAEQRATYAYEVAAARSEDPEPLLRRMGEHEEAAAAGSAVLSQHCMAEPLPSVAYALEDRFLSDADAALGELESALVTTYTDLVGVSAPGPVRDWAIRQLAHTAQRSAGPGNGAVAPDGPGAFPGIDPAEYPEPAPAEG